MYPHKSEAWFRRPHLKLQTTISPGLCRSQPTADTALRRYICRLTGSACGLQTQFGRLTLLTALEFSSNEITGTLPSELGASSCGAATARRNESEAFSRPALGLLTDLTDSVEVSGTSVCGSIPTQLSSMNFDDDSVPLGTPCPTPSPTLTAAPTLEPSYSVAPTTTVNPTPDPTGPRQASALSDLYQALGGESWSNNYGWLSGDPCTSSWSGISCSWDKQQDVPESLSMSWTRSVAPRRPASW